MMTDKLCYVKLSKIDLDDKRCCFSYPEKSDQLKRSIEKHGFMCPVILKKRGEKYFVVSGFRRLSAAVSLRIDDVPALITEKDDFSCFEFAVFENLSSRELNVFEISNILAKLSGVFEIKTDIMLTHYLPLFGYNGHKRILDRLFFIRSLSKDQKETLFVNNIESEKIILLADLDREWLDKSIALLVDLKPGLNKFKQILELFLEISQREGIPMADLFADEKIDSILSDKVRTGSQKLNQLRVYLMARRFPMLSRKEDDFRKKRNKLKLDGSIKLTPQPSFEGTFFDVNFRFKKKEELRKHVQQLLDACDNPELDDIIGFL